MNDRYRQEQETRFHPYQELRGFEGPLSRGHEYQSSSQFIYDHRLDNPSNIESNFADDLPLHRYGQRLSSERSTLPPSYESAPRVISSYQTTSAPVVSTRDSLQYEGPSTSQRYSLVPEPIASVGTFNEDMRIRALMRSVNQRPQAPQAPCYSTNVSRSQVMREAREKWPLSSGHEQSAGLPPQTWHTPKARKGPREREWVDYSNSKLEKMMRKRTFPFGLTLNHKLKVVKEPVIGLKFITEYDDPDVKTKAEYLCKLCEAHGMAQNMLVHILSYNHRRKYMEFFSLGDFPENGTPTDLKNVERKAYAVEQVHGRGQMRFEKKKPVLSPQKAPKQVPKKVQSTPSKPSNDKAKISKPQEKEKAIAEKAKSSETNEPVLAEKPKGSVVVEPTLVEKKTSTQIEKVYEADEDGVVCIEEDNARQVQEEVDISEDTGNESKYFVLQYLNELVANEFTVGSETEAALIRVIVRNMYNALTDFEKKGTSSSSPEKQSEKMETEEPAKESEPPTKEQDAEEEKQGSEVSNTNQMDQTVTEKNAVPVDEVLPETSSQNNDNN